MNVRSAEIPTIGLARLAEVIDSNDRVVLDISSEYCTPCSVLGSSLNEIAPHYPEVQFFKIDIEKTPEVADRYDVEAVPFLVFMKDGRVAKKVIGYLGQEKLENDLLRFLGRPTRDLTEVFADGGLWDLDDSDAFEVIENTDHIVLFFQGTDSSDSSSYRKRLRKLAKEFQRGVFFGALRAEDSVLIRKNLRIPRKQGVLVYLHQGVVLRRRLSKVSIRELRQDVVELAGRR